MQSHHRTAVEAFARPSSPRSRGTPRLAAPLARVRSAAATLTVAFATLAAGITSVHAQSACDGPLAASGAVVRFLTQATFGPTREDICALARMVEREGSEAEAFEAWIDQQLRMPATPLADHFDPDSGNYQHSLSRRLAWFEAAVGAPDQLRQRLAFALSELFVVSEKDGTLSRREGQVGLQRYYNMLLAHAFGDYRALIERVTFDPVMGHYLTVVRSQAATGPDGAQPDENYAREILQLMSIGLDLLRPNGQPRLDRDGNRIPTFDQDTILAFARAFTGLNYDLGEVDDNPCRGWAGRGTDFTRPMVLCDRFHDHGEKRLLAESSSAAIIPAGQGAERDIRDALDNIAGHPNVSPFLARRLIERFVTSNPSPAYIRRVADAFDNSGGNLGATVKAVLLDDEARSERVADRDYAGKMREPLLLVTGLWRAFDGSLEGLDPRIARIEPFGQSPQASPSVFNFFQPEYQPAIDTSAVRLPAYIEDSGLYAPEMQVMTELATIQTHNDLRVLIHGNASQVPLALDDELAMLRRTPEELVSHLDQLLLAGTMSEALHTAIARVIESPATNSEWPLRQRLYDILYLIVTSPEFAVQR
ncbi:MAG: DUF1800 family protein [Rhodocyclaceae bacterium]|nr:DUF1800 family protein [Rhodocyclaceae bacterium]